ncbi:MAG: helix-turn-helix transcriptional regulator [Pseudomonadota bacterium]
MTAEQVRMARAALQLGVRDLADLAGVAPGTLSRFETGKGGINLSTAQKIREALEAAGIQFIDKNGGGVGVRFRDRLDT